MTTVHLAIIIMGIGGFIGMFILSVLACVAEITEGLNHDNQ